MRLIDVDKLIETLEENISKLARDIKLEQREMQLSIFVAQLCQTKHIIGVIDEQPTAFNVDKVVSELEKSHFHTESTFDDDGYCNDDSEEVVNLNEAIEIVRRCGIDE